MNLVSGVSYFGLGGSSFGLSFGRKFFKNFNKVMLLVFLKEMISDLMVWLILVCRVFLFVVVVMVFSYV